MIKTGFKDINDFVDFKDFLDYKEVEELYFIVINIYDFGNKCFRFLPFAGGYMGQEDTDSKKWQALNYMISKILQEKGGS
ncbi:MAG: hypothetical protein GYA14_13810 [Ignavibacteria bacterium]|nr:hypothetical protein [Ignavibacteria bacterium]